MLMSQPSWEGRVSKMRKTLIETPLGPLSASINEADELVALGFGASPGLISDPSTAVHRQVEEYFAGYRRVFDLALAPKGTPFQKSVWAELMKITFGETRSYTQIAQTLNNPCARAIGTANGSNPIAIIVPCHRVIGRNGTLTGYAGGLEFKRKLLELEGALTPSLL